MSNDLRRIRINVDNALQYLHGRNEGDLASAMRGFSDDVVYRGIERRGDGIYRRLYQGKSEVQRYIGAWLKTASGVKYEVLSVKQFGDGVFIHWTDSTTGGGGQYANEGILVFEFNEEGLVNHARPYSAAGPIAHLDFLGGDQT
jgi:hypothetical protein